MSTERSSVFGVDENRDLLSELISVYGEILGDLNKISEIFTIIQLLSVNSSIEAARAGAAGKGFGVIAREIKSMSDRSNEINRENFTHLSQIRERINAIAGMHVASTAFDLVDKIDRNLFERNCDVQAWATFEAVVEFLKDTSDQKRKKADALLTNIYKIYEVYADILLTDKNGIVVESVTSKNLIGRDWKDRQWFSDVRNKMGPVATDMYWSDNYNRYVMSFGAPVIAPGGEFLGICSTRFDWNFAYDIVDRCKSGKHADVYLINSAGDIIASKNRSDVFRKDVKNNEGVKAAIGHKRDFGFCLHEDTSGKITDITGFAMTKGYNQYAGKGWSGVVVEHLR